MTKKHRKRLSRRQAEPALYRGAVVAVLSVLAMLGFGWAADVDQSTITVIAGAIALIAPAVQAWWTRRAVTANAKVIARVTTRGEVVTGDAAEPALGRELTIDGGNGSPTIVGGIVVKPELVE